MYSWLLALYPHGEQLSKVAHDFTIQAAANRYAHPAATYIGSMWKNDLVNEQILKKPVPGGVRWQDLKVDRFKASASNVVSNRK